MQGIQYFLGMKSVEQIAVAYDKCNPETSTISMFLPFKAFSLKVCICHFVGWEKLSAFFYISDNILRFFIAR